MNPNLKGREMRKAFDSDDYQVMLVANKFQTGFDQPKLCAMYVDKKLGGGVRTNLIPLKPDLSG
jgi:type I restriction enzyme R subunit